MVKYGDLVKLDECKNCIYNIPGIRCIDYINGKIQIQILVDGEPVINQTRVKGECSTTKADIEDIINQLLQGVDQK